MPRLIPVSRLTTAVLMAVVGLGACSSGPSRPETGSTAQSYAAGVLADRAEKDVFYRAGEQSPIPPAERASFEGLAYYPVSPAYRVPASLEPDEADGDRIIELPTSQNTMDRLRVVGTLQFSLQGATHRLTAFANVDARTIDRLFVPFRDATSDDETYGGGRYLDLDRTATGLYDLDFNRAYHPYCVFNIEYICPVPPPENTLDVPILAGERLAGTPATER